MYIIPDADLIAIGRNTLNGHQYKLLSSSELQSCTQRNHVYLCEQHQILRNDLEGSCLGALYLQSARGVRENCRLERRELRETVYQLSANDHIVISPQTLVTQIQCNNGSHYPIKLEKMSKIHVPPSCTVALRNHTISADTNIRIAPEPLQFHWEFDFLDLPSEMLNTAGHIDDQMNSVKIALGLLQLDAVKEHEFENLLNNSVTSPSSYASILIWLSVFIAVTTFALLTCWYCRNKRQYAKQRLVQQDDVVQNPGGIRMRNFASYFRKPTAPVAPTGPRTMNEWLAEPNPPRQQHGPRTQYGPSNFSLDEISRLAEINNSCS